MPPAQAKIVKQLKSGKFDLWHVDHQGSGRDFFIKERTVCDLPSNLPPNDPVVMFFEARNHRRDRGPSGILRSVMNSLIGDNVIEPYCEDGRRVFYRLKGE